MKKTKYFLFTLICLFSWSTVLAKNEVVIKSITPIYDEASNVTVDDKDNKHQVTFNDKNQNVKYNVVIENVSDYSLKVNTIDLTNPTKDYLFYKIEGINNGDILKSKDQQEFVISLKTKEEVIESSITDELVANISFEKTKNKEEEAPIKDESEKNDKDDSENITEENPEEDDEKIENPFTNDKGLLIILIAATGVTSACIIIYKRNKVSRYLVILVMAFAAIPMVNAQDNINLEIRIKIIYNAPQPIVYDWQNKSAVFVGDSITYGTGTTSTSKTYWNILDNTLGLSDVTGMGVNSSTISAKSDYGTTKEPLINRYVTIPKADLIMIFMGTNDYGHETPLGNINHTTDESFYGALNLIISNLQKALPNSRIVLITPIHRYGRGSSAILGSNYTYDNLPNGVGANLEDYVNAIKEVGQKYDVPIIDLFTLYDLDPSDENIRNKYMPDGLHPNDEGHQIMADLIAKELRKISPKKTVTDESVSDINKIKIEYGNDYGSANLNSLNRASVSKNIYLEAGTVISLVNSEKFKYALYSQTSENIVYTTNITNGYITSNYTITTSGWYGFALARIDNSEFDLGGADSNLLIDYINFTEAPPEPEIELNVPLQSGNHYGATTGNALNRATVTKNIYLKEGTIIELKDPAKYKYAVYNLPSEEIIISTNISGGFITTDYRISTSGWYGFVFAKDSNFDLGGSDPILISDYLDIK